MKTAHELVMVELRSGYGDGYGVVRIDDLSAASVVLEDCRVKVPSEAIKRIIGPLTCDEAIRIHARRYTRNWNDAAFVEQATADELREAFAHDHEGDTYAAMCALRARQ